MIEIIIILAVCGIILAFYLGYKQANLKSENAELKQEADAFKQVRKSKQKSKKKTDEEIFNDTLTH